MQRVGLVSPCFGSRLGGHRAINRGGEQQQRARLSSSATGCMLPNRTLRQHPRTGNRGVDHGGADVHVAGAVRRRRRRGRRPGGRAHVRRGDARARGVDGARAAADVGVHRAVLPGPGGRRRERKASGCGEACVRSRVAGCGRGSVNTGRATLCFAEEPNQGRCGGGCAPPAPPHKHGAGWCRPARVWRRLAARARRTDGTMANIALEMTCAPQPKLRKLEQLLEEVLPA